MVRNIKNTLRLLRILIILTQEDALFVLRPFTRSTIFSALSRLRLFPKPVSEGVRLTAALQRLGPFFIKIGQTLSTRPDYIGDALSAELATLHDAIPPFESNRAKAQIEKDFKASVDILFAEFEDTPVAAASIAQVHKARLQNGKSVAVKILRPDIHRAFAKNLDLFFWLAEIAEKRISPLRRLKPVEIVQIFKQTTSFELDLRYEAAAATEMAENIKHDAGFRVPAIEWDLTSQHILVSEWVEGISISNVQALQDKGYNLDAILAKSSNNFFRHVFRDGFFHADLHPGNLFIDEHGDIVAVDFGIMGRLDWKSRIYMAEILRGFLNEDYNTVADAHFKAGYIPADQSREAFRQACMAITKPIINKPIHQISVAKLLGQLFNTTEAFSMEAQPQLFLLQKTMIVVEGVGRSLNNNVNMWELARGPIEEWANSNLTLKGHIRSKRKEFINHTKQLPFYTEQMQQALHNLSDPEGIKLSISSDGKGQSKSANYSKWYGWIVALCVIVWHLRSVS